MKKNKSLRRQLNIMFTLMVVFQTITILFSLNFSNVFNMLDFEAVRTFSNITETNVSIYNTYNSKIMAFISQEDDILSKKIERIANQNNVTINEIYENNTLYEQMITEISDTLIYTLNQINVTGAYVILDHVTTDNNSIAHYSVYLRDNVPEKTSNGDIQLNVGPISVSQKYQLPTSSNWTQQFIEPSEAQNFDFYNKPINAANELQTTDILRCGYWTTPLDMFNDGANVICYSVPLFDSDGNTFGVMGIEIDLNYLTQNILVSSDLFFENSFFMLSDFNGTTLNESWATPGNALGNALVTSSNPLELKSTDNENIYELDLDRLGTMSCYVSELNMYSGNSPFLDEIWVLSCLVQKSVLYENSNDVIKTLLFNIIATTIFSIIVVFVYNGLYTRKIRNLSTYLSTLSPLDEINFEEIGIFEIDELTEAVTKFNQSLIDTNDTTSKILELSLLPLGGYEILHNSSNVKLTDFLYNLIHIKKGSIVTKEEWNLHYEKLTMIAHDEYDNVYYYLDDISQTEYWLRIKTATAKNSIIGVVFDVTEEIRENAKLINQLEFDALTGLRCQTAFKARASNIIEKNPNKIGALAFIDLDNLKYINDNFGHEFGDKLIIGASKIFSNFEQYKAITCRYSGDEFALFFWGYDSKEELAKVISLLKQESNKHYIDLPNGTQNKIRFSGGVAWYPDDASDIKDLLKIADFTMLEAKQREKGSIYEFNKFRYDNMSYLLENIEAINKLIDEQLIRFAFQPIVDLKTGEIFAYEALMRPLIAEFNGPLEVISVAAAQSKLPHLERVIMSVVFDTIDKHIDVIGDRHIFINSIPNEAIEDNQAILVQNIKDQYGKYFEKVVVEILERDSRDEDRLVKTVNFLKDNGLKIAIDDFGSGYSNEVRIMKLSPNIVKIDMELIQGIASNTDKQTLVKGILDFCHSKNIRIVAEGVECQEDLYYLMDIDVDYIQGYYLAKPNFEFLDLPENKKQEIINYTANSSAPKKLNSLYRNSNKRNK